MKLSSAYLSLGLHLDECIPKIKLINFSIYFTEVILHFLFQIAYHYCLRIQSCYKYNINEGVVNGLL